MKLKIAFALALSLFAGTANAEKIALVNGTLINIIFTFISAVCSCSG